MKRFNLIILLAVVLAVVILGYALSLSRPKAAPTARVNANQPTTVVVPETKKTEQNPITWTTSKHHFILTAPNNWRPQQLDAGGGSTVIFREGEKTTLTFILASPYDFETNKLVIDFDTWVKNGGSKQFNSQLEATAKMQTMLGGKAAIRQVERRDGENTIAYYLELPGIYVKVFYLQVQQSVVESALKTLRFTPTAEEYQSASVIP